MSYTTTAPRTHTTQVNLGAAIRRGRSLKCKGCKERGATIGCQWRGCQSVFHLPCAARHDCAMDVRTYKLFCVTHRRHAAAWRLDEDIMTVTVAAPPAALS